MEFTNLRYPYAPCDHQELCPSSAPELTPTWYAFCFGGAATKCYDIFTYNPFHLLPRSHHKCCNMAPFTFTLMPNHMVVWSGFRTCRAYVGASGSSHTEVGGIVRRKPSSFKRTTRTYLELSVLIRAISELWEGRINVRRIRSQLSWRHYHYFLHADTRRACPAHPSLGTLSSTTYNRSTSIILIKWMEKTEDHWRRLRSSLL